MSSATRIVVVGGGLAATRCIEELRRADAPLDIVLLSEELQAPYDRPPLTKAYLKDGGPRPHLRASWDELDIELRLGVRAQGLDLAGGSALTADGHTVCY